MMTVGELITALQRHDSDQVVRFVDAEWGPTDVSRVRIYTVTEQLADIGRAVSRSNEVFVPHVVIE